jgi:oligosaccharide repeat unit polymerase
MTGWVSYVHSNARVYEVIYYFCIVISLFIAYGLHIRWKRCGFSLLSPAGFYAILWSFVWLMQLVNPFGYYEVRNEIIVLSLLSVIMIGVGEFVGFSIKQPMRYQQTIYTNKFNNFLNINIIMAVVASIVIFFSVYIIFGNPFESGIGKIIKEARGEDGIGMLRESPWFYVAQYANVMRGFLYLIMFVSIPLWLINRKKSIILASIALLSSVILDISWGSRTLILDSFFMLLFWYMLVNKKNKINSQKKSYSKKMVFVILIAGLLVIAQLLTTSTREKSLMDIKGLKVPYSAGQLLLYYSSPLVTFDQTFDKNETTYGLMSFGGVVNLLHLLRIYRDENLFVYDIMYDWEVDNPYYGDGGWNKRANTYSWLRYLYSDFGVLGLVIIPFVLGLISGYRFKKIALNSGVNIIDYIVLAFCFYIVVRSPIIMPLRTDYIVLSVILLFVASVLLKKRSIKVVDVKKLAI